MKKPNSTLSGFGTTIFEVMTRLALENNAINLGQGFPDGGYPEDVLEAAADAIFVGSNQYPPMLGTPDLRRAVSDHLAQIYGLETDWQTETLITSGATEALASTFLALIEPGDEVIVLEPLYDCYIPLIKRAGGVPVSVRLTPPDWSLPAKELEAAFSERTKLILINSPMNPTGKVFAATELAFIAELVRKWDAFAVCDEVYEHLVFDSLRHIPLITLPGMRERTVRIGSAGKTFSLTGWKVGYVSGPADMIRPIAKAHQFLVFTTPPNLQSAVAYGLRKEEHFFRTLAQPLEQKRDRLRRGLESVGMQTLDCGGTYFLVADIGAMGWEDGDVEFCIFLVENAQVAAVPMSAFYQDEGPSRYVRFAFCKQDSILDEAVDRLTRQFSATSLTV